MENNLFNRRAPFDYKNYRHISIFVLAKEKKFIELKIYYFSDKYIYLI